MLLEILALMKDERVSSNEVINLVKRSKTEAEFTNAIKELIPSTYEKFRGKVIANGIGLTKVKLWENLLQYYFTSIVENTLAQRLGLKLADVSNNIIGLSTLHNELASNLALSEVSYGMDLYGIIKNQIGTVLTNNSAKYRKAFKVSVNDENVNPTIVEQVRKNLKLVSNVNQALLNIPNHEVASILSDLFDTRAIYTLHREGIYPVYYSMYESFLRVHFNFQTKEFNRKYQKSINITLGEHPDAKFKKLDIVMEEIYLPFIMAGISIDTLHDLQNAVFTKVNEININSVGSIFNVTELANEKYGNFNSGRKYTNHGSTNNFSIFIRGLLALSKLVQHLKNLEISPYVIDPNIFLPTTENPALKFSSLYELVNYSGLHTKVREEYDLKLPFYNINAVHHKKDLILKHKGNNIVAANRKEIAIKELSNRFGQITSDKFDYRLTTVQVIELKYQASLFDLARYMSEGKNPLYLFFSENEMLFDPYDEEEVLNPAEMHEQFTELLGVDANPYLAVHLTRTQLLDMFNATQTDLKDLWTDLQFLGLDKTLDILLSIELFSDQFRELLQNLLTEDGFYISQVEYTNHLYKSEILKPLDAVLDVKDTTPAYLLVGKVIHALLKNYFDTDITYQEINSYLDQSYLLTNYENFVMVYIKRMFEGIAVSYLSAKANLFNLSEYGTPIKLPATRINDILMNVPEPLTIQSREVFERKYGQFRKDYDGYLIDNNRELVSVLTLNNKVGALHSTGYYIFTDGSAELWERGANR